MAWRVGVDSGGTFTDVCLFDEDTGRIEVWKVASTPDDPSRGITDGVIEGIGRAGAAPDAIAYFGHGTTVATNALIQHRGVRTGLITTEGFRDLLEIGRQKRPDLYDLQADKPPVLVPRDLRLEVPEVAAALPPAWKELLPDLARWAPASAHGGGKLPPTEPLARRREPERRERARR